MFHNTSISESPGLVAAENDDVDLVRRFNAGDESAFTTIMGRYHSRVLAVVRRQMNNDIDAEDIAQDTFIRAHRGLANFRGDSSLATWLNRIAMNLARNRYWYFFRRHRQNTVSLNQPVNDQAPNRLPELIAVDPPSPLRQAMHSEFVELIARCLDQLEPPHRQILHMRYILHYSYEQIGDELSLNFGTVKSRMARARGKLRKLILNAAPEFGCKASMDDFFEPVRDLGATPTPTFAA
jgi:RNA polymerase sigma-70 factor (ECF subfamily)